MNITNKTQVKSYEGNRLEWSLNFRANFKTGTEIEQLYP